MTDVLCCGYGVKASNQQRRSAFKPASLSTCYLHLTGVARLRGAPLQRWLVYEARAVIGFVFSFSFASRVCAAGPEECGFCPVINWPALTTWTVQFAVFEKTAPSFSISSS